MSNEKNKKKLKRGQRPEGWKNNCAKFKEYYATQHPDWTKEQCVEAAKKFNRKNNYKTIEYWEYRFPDATHEEHLEMRKQMIDEAKSNHPQNIRYWEKNFPDATHEEHLEMLNNFNKENNSQCIEFYEKRFPDATHEEHLEMLNASIKNRIAVRPDLSGENNGMHRSKTTDLERRQISPKCIEFYEKRFPDATHEEHLEMLNAHLNKVSNILHDKTKQPKCIEFWLAKGYNEEEAKQLISESQKTFSLEKCIEKYGEVEGIKRFEKRQEKWVKSLRKNFSKYGDGRSNGSEFAYDIIGCICKRICINRPLKEKYMTDKNGNHYAYDFCHNKKIIEFNGDYWHMNPKIYKANDINKTKKLTAQEVWDFDKRKMECAEEHGYKLLYIWESEYNESRSAVIKKCMEFLTQ